MLSPSTVADIELDIEEELRDENVSHALPFCPRHKGAQFFPVSGTIVEAICGKLLRIKQYVTRPHKKCTRCAAFQGRAMKCNYCGIEVIG